MQYSILPKPLTVAISVFILLSVSRPALCNVIGVHVPVVLNIYTNANVTEQEARDAIKEANKILKQAGFRMVVVRVNSITANSGGTNFFGGDNGAGGGTAGDGDFTEGERQNMRTFGGKELMQLGNRKGIKISFGRTPLVGSITPGVSVHRDPTIIVKKRDTTANTAQTIAHEFGHVLTLCVNHKIDETTRANLDGHAPDAPGESGNGNLMAPSNRRTGTVLTPAQIQEMQKRRYVHGKCSTQFSSVYPAIKDSQQFGGTTDRRGDHTSGSGIYDLHQTFLTSLDAATDRTGGDVHNIKVQVTVFSPLPTTGAVDAMYALGFNIDASSETGVTYAGLNGIDRIVYANGTGDIGLGPLN